MNETHIFVTAFGVYLKENPSDPEKAAALAKTATKIAMNKWHEEEKKEGPK